MCRGQGTPAGIKTTMLLKYRLHDRGKEADRKGRKYLVTAKTQSSNACLHSWRMGDGGGWCDVFS